MTPSTCSSSTRLWWRDWRITRHAWRRHQLVPGVIIVLHYVQNAPSGAAKMTFLSRHAIAFHLNPFVFQDTAKNFDDMSLRFLCHRPRQKHWQNLFIIYLKLTVAESIKTPTQITSSKLRDARHSSGRRILYNRNTTNENIQNDSNLSF